MRLTRMCQLKMTACARIFKELGINASDFYPMTGFSDSKGAIAQGNHPVSDSKLIHVNNQEFYCREVKQLGQVKFEWVERAYNCADIRTHMIKDAIAFEKFVAFMMNTGPILYNRATLLKET